MSVATVEKLTDSVGAIVHGVDKERLLHDDSLAEWTLTALEQNGALVFRDLHIDDDTQIAFSRKLGTLELLGKPDKPEIFQVTLDQSKNRSAQYLKGTFDWHIDGLTDDIPIMATVLSAVAVADEGGETEFASTYGAYDALSDEDKERYESIRVVHTIEASQRGVNPNPSPEVLAILRSRPAKTHPLIWEHRDGRKSLVLGATADYIEGMDEEEGRKLLAELLDFSTTPDKVYRHEWQVGDMVIWDNRGVLHRALRYPEDSPRDMHRCTLAGDEAIK